MNFQDDQKGLFLTLPPKGRQDALFPVARPQEARPPRRTFAVYVEGDKRPRTKLGAFFSILNGGSS